MAPRQRPASGLSALDLSVAPDAGRSPVREAVGMEIGAAGTERVAERLLRRIVCGVDESAASAVAVAQVAQLREPTSEVILLGVVDARAAALAGWPAAEVWERLEAGEREALDAARATLPEAEPVTGAGTPPEVLLEEIRDRRATLVAVGTHQLGRAAGIFLGSVATAMLHHAPCSVLVARPCAAGTEFPRRIVVGVDGSRASLGAAAAAERVASRVGADVTALAATGGGLVDVDGVAEVARRLRLEWSDRRPVDALVAASRDADLVVVGSRGLAGLKALGSVSERVAHRADASVLVVRPAEVAR